MKPDLNKNALLGESEQHKPRKYWIPFAADVRHIIESIKKIDLTSLEYHVPLPIAAVIIILVFFIGTILVYPSSDRQYVEEVTAEDLAIVDEVTNGFKYTKYRVGYNGVMYADDAHQFCFDDYSPSFPCDQFSNVELSSNEYEKLGRDIERRCPLISDNAKNIMEHNNGILVLNDMRILEKACYAILQIRVDRQEEIDKQEAKEEFIAAQTKAAADLAAAKDKFLNK